MNNSSVPTVATRKQKEIAELLRREISTIILHELNDPRMGFVTVTRVRLARDFRSAKVFATVRGLEADVRNTFEALQHARGYVQACIADRLNLRYTPVLQFAEDEELGQALRVDRLIEQLKREHEEREQEEDAG